MVSSRRTSSRGKKMKHDDVVESDLHDENENENESPNKRLKLESTHDERTPPQSRDSDEGEMPSSKKKSKTSGEKNGSISRVDTPIRRVNPVGKMAEAGIIKKIYVENFMCHRKLTVELCRNVNFIHGQNGSGKSAILAAIQICLGAGARRTHRARNMKELVRKEAGSDCSGAKVRVTLWNKGSDAFQQETYGEEITVERTISLRGGGNTYKLLDFEGNEQSRSKRDLDMLLDQLNIQVMKKLFFKSKSHNGSMNIINSDHLFSDGSIFHYLFGTTI